MAGALPRVMTIAPGPDFLALLAQAVLQGFPAASEGQPLAAWTILLPTRRAARRFGQILRQQQAAPALVLPRIKPIGDLDEDRLWDEAGADDLPPALSKSAEFLLLLQLASAWAQAHSEIAFAREIAASPVQALSLAQSLQQLVETMETQEVPLAQLQQAYDVELSEHHEAILSLLGLLAEKLPALHAAGGTMGATARRSAMIRREAARIAAGGATGPIIAAGSTGTIPATRALLAAIAAQPQGAVVLPGLDQMLDEASWDALAPDHAQYAMKQLLAELGVKRSEVGLLGTKPGPRQLLLSELMRPTETAEAWHATLPRRRQELASALPGLTIIEAPDRHVEARSIALVLREALEHPARTAALITPNRDLAARVAAELARWNITIEDSAGHSLAEAGAGRALDLLLEAAGDGFAPEKLFAFLHAAPVSLGFERTAWLSALRNIEIAALRGVGLGEGEAYATRIRYAKQALAQNPHAHPLLLALTEADWQSMAEAARAIDALLAPLQGGHTTSLGDHMQRLDHALRQACTGLDWETPLNIALADFWEELVTASPALPQASFAEAVLLVQALLRRAPAPPTSSGHPRIEILGMLEARLLPYDCVVLGGLNETVWPAQTDPGAWLNRAMRSRLGLPQPERDIGLAAHDFEQGFAFPSCVLSLAQRLGGAPAGPSRWLLRLKTVLDVAGLEAKPLAAGPWVDLALALAAPDGPALQKGPMGKPAPRPPPAARPRKFSVTEIERLIRNPYAIYARRVLALEPLPEFGQAPDAALRGSLFHAAIAQWNRAQAPDLESLLAAGVAQFSAFTQDAEIRNFWWPHFRRVAQFLAEEEAGLKQGLLHIHAEQAGRISFDAGGAEHMLSARADRIDILASGAARLIDYKTGKPPTPDQVESGLSPQLTLEAAILLRGGFAALAPQALDEAVYLRISGARQGLAKQPATHQAGAELAGLAQAHLAGLTALLATYQQSTMAYLPRLRVFKEEEPADYDHLSRFLEWQLAGKA